MTSTSTLSIDQLPPPPPNRTGWPWDTAVRCLRPTMPNGQPWPRITVVTPNYNFGQYLEETMRSVLMQGYPNLQYIVIDGGSTDNSVEIIRRYEKFLGFWKSQKDAGQPTAINYGMAQATGDILGWLNSDDLLLPRALERTARARMDPRVKITCGFREWIDPESRVWDYMVHLQPTQEDLRRIICLSQETVFWNREVWDKAGPLDAKWRYALDLDLWQRFITAGYEFHLLPYFIGCYRHHPETKGSTLGTIAKKEVHEIMSRVWGRDVDVDALPSEVNWGRRNRLLRRSAKYGLMHYPPVARLLLRFAPLFS